MSYLGRAWVAASVAVVQGHTDQSLKRNAGFKSTGFFRPLAGVITSGILLRNCDGVDQRKQVDDSLQKAMYMNCWGPS